MFTIISLYNGTIFVSLSILLFFGPQGLKLEFPGVFSDPKIQPLFEFDWQAYLCNKKRVSHVTNLELVLFIHALSVSEFSVPILYSHIRNV